MVASGYIESFRGVHRYCNRRKLARDIREAHDTSYRGRGGTRTIFGIHLI